MLFLVKFEDRLDGSLSYDTRVFEGTSPEDAIAQAKDDMSFGWYGGSYEGPTYSIVEVMYV